MSLSITVYIYRVLGRLGSAIVFKFDEFRINLTVHARIIDKNMYLLEPSKPYIVSIHYYFGQCLFS